MTVTSCGKNHPPSRCFQEVLQHGEPSRSIEEAAKVAFPEPVMGAGVLRYSILYCCPAYSTFWAIGCITFDSVDSANGTRT